MLEKGRINVRQLAVLVFMCTIGDMILLYPTFVSNISHQDAWIGSLIGLVAGAGVVLLLLHVHGLYPELSLVEASRRILGPWVGSFISCWYLIYFLVNLSLMVREGGDFLTTQIYIDTPLRAIQALLLLLLVLALFSGLEPLGRTIEIILPLFLISAIALIVCLIPQYDVTRLLPVFENGILPTSRTILYAISLPFGELSIFLMIFPYVNKQAHMKKEVLIAAVAGGSILSIILLVSLLVLGPFISSYSIYSSFLLAQKVDIGHFIQRIEALLAFAWVMTDFVKTSLYFYGFVLGTSQLFKLKNYRSIILPTSMIVFGLSIMISPNIEYVLETTPLLVDWDFTNGVVIPLILWGVYVIKRKWNKSQTT